MYIEAVQISLLCENPECAGIVRLHPKISLKDDGTVSAIKPEQILQTAKRSGWIVIDGMAFCSQNCESIARNTRVKNND